MPAEEPMQIVLIQHVEIGPNIADVMIVGSQIIGFFRMFLNCNIEVPIPIEITIPMLLSLRD